MHECHYHSPQCIINVNHILTCYKEFDIVVLAEAGFVALVEAGFVVLVEAGFVVLVEAGFVVLVEAGFWDYILAVVVSVGSVMCFGQVALEK